MLKTLLAQLDGFTPGSSNTIDASLLIPPHRDHDLIDIPALDDGPPGQVGDMPPHAPARVAINQPLGEKSFE